MLISTQLSGFGGGGVAAYTAQGVFFDGTNDYLTRGADLTNNADSKLLTGSFWFKRAATAANQHLLGADSFLIVIQLQSDDKFRLVFQNAAGGEILDITLATTFGNTNWHNVLFSLDMASEASSKVFVDDGNDAFTASTFTDDTIDFTRTDYAIGARPDGTNKMNGDLADIWIDFGRFVDLTVEANRRLFIDADGCPVDLGSDGSKPFSAVPIMYFSGPTDAWHTNKGDGGGFTENGALTDAATDPC